MYWPWPSMSLLFSFAGTIALALAAAIPDGGGLTFQPGIIPAQHAILMQAYSDAIYLATNALRPPAVIDGNHQWAIYDKYFERKDRLTIESIYRKLYNEHVTSGFRFIVVDVTDSRGECRAKFGNTTFAHLDDKLITICLFFWEHIGNRPPRSCADITQNIMSWQMIFPGNTIFHLLLKYIGKAAIGGQDLKQWGYPNRDGKPYSGVENAMEIRDQRPDLTITSVDNYDWYALELYWTSKCGRSFRGPMNSIENETGKCTGSHCNPSDHNDIL